MSEWVISVSSRSWQFLQSYRDWNKVYQAQWFGLWTKSCVYMVYMYWTCLVLVRPVASLYSASPLKHHATCMQWCPNPDHYPDWAGQSVSNSFMLSAKQSSRTSNFNVVCLTWPRIEPPTSCMPGEHSTTTLPGRGPVDKEENCLRKFSVSAHSCLSLISPLSERPRDLKFRQLLQA